MSRTSDRRDESEATRIRLLEKDADDGEERDAELKALLMKLVWSVCGLLVSVTTASILLLLNLSVGGN